MTSRRKRHCISPRTARAAMSSTPNGTLLMSGPFGNPQEEGAMSVFTTREAAEEFVKGDPFVRNGVIRNWYIREWNEGLVKP
jgi:uncharacterized protein YciI